MVAVVSIFHTSRLGSRSRALGPAMNLPSTLRPRPSRLPITAQAVVLVLVGAVAVAVVQVGVLRLMLVSKQRQIVLSLTI